MSRLTRWAHKLLLLAIVSIMLVASGPILPIDMAVFFAIDFTLYVEALIAVMLIGSAAPWRAVAGRWRRQVSVRTRWVRRGFRQPRTRRLRPTPRVPSPDERAALRLAIA